MGTLTWGHGIRPAEERVKDFCAAYPPEDPVTFCKGSLKKNRKKEFVVGTTTTRLARFRATDWRPGSLHDLLAVYGLKLPNAPAQSDRALQLDPLKTVTRRRNMKLRVLHSDIDTSPMDMDAAKAEYLDRQEKQQAALEIREARQRMKAELKKKP